MIPFFLDLFYSFLDFDIKVGKIRIKMKKEMREEDEEMSKILGVHGLLLGSIDF